MFRFTGFYPLDGIFAHRSLSKSCSDNGKSTVLEHISQDFLRFTRRGAVIFVSITCGSGKFCRNLTQAVEITFPLTH